MNYFSHTKKECKRNIKLLRGVMKYQSKYYYTEHCVKCNHKISDFKKYYSGVIVTGKHNSSNALNTEMNDFITFFITLLSILIFLFVGLVQCLTTYCNLHILVVLSDFHILNIPFAILF